MKEKAKVGILRVLTTSDPEVLLAHQNQIKAYFPEFEYETKCIPDQFEGIHDDETYDIAFPKIVAMAKEWESEIDGLIISCAGDPAVSVLQKELSIPVVGAGVAAASLSLNYGGKVGIIGIEEAPPPAYLEVLGDRLVGYELPKGIGSTNDLQTEKGKAAVVKSAKALVKKNCDVIAFACTGLSTANAVHLIKDIGIPVVDAVMAEGLLMKYKIMEERFRKQEGVG